MAGNTTLIIPRAPLFGGRAPMMTPGYTPLPPLRRVTEDGNARALETGTDFRVSERNTHLAP